MAGNSKQRNSCARGALALGASVLALMAHPALAQDNQQDNQEANSTEPEGPGNQIIVTAQFREQNLQDTPLAITAVTGATMEAKSQTDLAKSSPTARRTCQISSAGCLVRPVGHCLDPRHRPERLQPGL